MARQGKNQRKSGVYVGVNEHFKLIFNAVWASAGSFRTKPNGDQMARSVVQMSASARASQ
ncbi:hypothetical protein C1H66_01655 [Halomonas heilongjiangensis]|uniref:Uncharacterized protein n=1 Tax=Halomonas heilongjiangensis TaxID=1387883 RepID=A0A2N7TTZ7_9GAMM|nr:hypothetical protein C1H66_01655 [Halomonas heilongjiangensis]